MSPRTASSALALFCLAGALWGAPGFVDVNVNSLSVERLDKFEVTFTLSGTGYANPFDPAEIKVKAVFTSPTSRSLTVRGFYHQGFSRSGFPDTETLTPTEAAWKVRFTPDEVGAWTYELTAVDSTTGTGVSGLQSFDCVGSAQRGFVRKSGKDDRYFEYDDGTQFVPVGSNVSWALWPGYTYLYDQWLPEMAAQGANYARYWMCSWYHGIEWLDTPLGDYTNRQDHAWRLDYDIELARAEGIQVMLCLVNHGSVSTWCNPEWDDNPYNWTNGGPCGAAGEFFTDAAARAYFKRRLRYIVARWGYAPNLIWELFNEADLTDGYVSAPAAVAAWHGEMAAYVRNLDDRHMIATSFCHSDNDPAVWNMPDMDFTQFHDYADPVAPEDSQRAIIADYRADYPTKPVFGGEFGFWRDGDSVVKDPGGIHFHNGMWGSVLSEAAGASALWWWDEYIDIQDLFYNYRGVANFTASLDYLGSGFVFSQPAATSGLKVFALKGPLIVAAWVLNADYNYGYVGQYGPPAAIADGVIYFTGLSKDGLWSVEWWDTVLGIVDHTDSATCSSGEIALPVPSTAWDWALKMTLSEPCAVLVFETSGATRVAEGGKSDTYEVVLSSMPSADVAVSVRPGVQVTATPSLLTFTAGDWDEPQAVRVRAVDDDVIEGGHTDRIRHTASSGDPDYDAIDIARVTVRIADNDRSRWWWLGCGAGTTASGVVFLVAGLALLAARRRRS